MSKQPTRVDGATTKRLAEDGDICPVCKSSRYLNPNMRFKVNPECYHKMCESCVERIFNSGPAPCPIAGCARTLRRIGFKTQTFGDLKVEREVDIRKRVMSAMSKKEDDFETLRNYNDYLEQVEEITWNLILKKDVEATESRLRRWEEHQKAELHPGASRRELEAAPADQVGLKKGVVQRKAPNASAGNTLDPSSGRDNEDKGFIFHGLKKPVATPKEVPFDPMDGWEITPQYYVLQEDYKVNWYKELKRDTAHRVAMWDVGVYSNRALREAFGGFAVFIEDEINVRNTRCMNADMSKEEAARACGGAMDVDMDDVF